MTFSEVATAFLVSGLFFAFVNILYNKFKGYKVFDVKSWFKPFGKRG